MNGDYNSLKRKKSFANDRLQKLRSTINDDASKSSNANFQKHTITPSIKSSIPHNTQGYQERKKLKAVRKLKINDSEKQQVFKQPTQKEINTADKHSDSFELCPSKRRKVDVCGSVSYSRENSRESYERSGSSKCSSVSDRSRKCDNQKTDKPFDYASPKVQSNNVKRSSASSRMQAIKNNSSTNFSDICISKNNFEYQHITSTPVNNRMSSISCSSGISKNYSEYLGKALNAMYNKVYTSQHCSRSVQVEDVRNNDSMDWEPDSPSNIDESNEDKSEREMYIIVDTNIFLDSLSFLEGITKYESRDGVKPIIYVPWMVFNELDFIKDNRSSGLKHEASKAIDFINKMLTQKGGKLIGQSIFEANKQMYVGKSPDDKITSCCLQVKEKGYNAMLLSNDKNLRNKLMINGIQSFSCNDFLKCVDDEPPHGDKLNILLTEMTRCCTSVITDCCQEAYGDVWNKLALLDRQPWNFQMCLDIFKKYWTAVFREKFLKQCLKTVEKIIQVMKNSASLKDPSMFENFVKDCLSLCFFLMDLEQHKDLIEGTTKKINLLMDQKL